MCAGYDDEEYSSKHMECKSVDPRSDIDFRAFNDKRIQFSSKKDAY